jgi:uncharacterized protein YukE
MIALRRNPKMSSDRRGSRQRRKPQFRNIILSPEIIALGFTDIQVQGKNMMLRHQDAGIIVVEYDSNNLTKTARLMESRLAESVGKPEGLPGGFDCKAFAALLSVELFRDLQNQYAQTQKEIQQEEQRVTTMLDEIAALKEENAEISFDKWQEILISKYNNLKDVVDKKIPKIWPGLEFGLSSLRILNIDDCTLPMIGILLGRPGSGKTVAISLLSRWLYGYYTDDWSPKAWISHTTSVESEEELEAIDMLPKIKDRQFLTPELATLFNLKEDDLRVALSKITRIADGHGFASDSGVYGHRAYGETMFTWLGAVVDIPHHVYKVMSNLGPRLYFFRLPFREITELELLSNLTGGEKFNAKFKSIEDALLDYLKWFEIGPTVIQKTPSQPHLRKVQWESSINDLDAIQCIVNLTKLLGYLRREGAAYMSDRINIDTDITENEGYSYFAGPMEDVTRASEVLANIASGHALITGRNYITMEDIPIVVKTVLSTARVERIKAFIALLDNDGVITKKELADQLHISRSTAFRYMTELMAIGLVDVKRSNEVEYTENNNPAMVKVMTLRKDKFEWFLSDVFKQLRDNFTPVDNKQFMNEEDPEAQAAKDVAAHSAASTNIAAGDKTEEELDNDRKMRDIYDSASAKARAGMKDKG